MNTQVYLHRNQIAVLALSRKRLWIFQNAIQQLLYKAALQSDSDVESDSTQDNYSEIEDEVNYLSGKDFGNIATEEHHDEELVANFNKFNIQFNDNCNTNQKLTTNSSGTFNVDDSDNIYISSIDNSSKRPSIDKIALSDPEEYEAVAEKEYFLHIALAEDEVTVMCPVDIMNELFQEPIALCKQLDYNDVELLPTEFMVLHVDSSDGYDNSSKALQLTKPLSMNKIPLFFLSTHFGDVVLVPNKERDKVIQILTNKNFEFSNLSNSFISDNGKVNRMNDHTLVPGVVSPVTDLENETFKLFEQKNVSPTIRPYFLLLTGSRSGDSSNTIRKFAQNLASLGDNLPSYLAITRTSLTEISLLLPKSSKIRSKLGFPSKCIMGSVSDSIVPVAIDLKKLPLDLTGVVAGLASRLISGSKRKLNHPLEMSYLSMARSGLIMVPKEDVKLVSEILDEKALS